MSNTLNLKELKVTMERLRANAPQPVRMSVSSLGWEKLERLVMPTYNNRGYLTGIPIQVVPDAERDFWINEVKIDYSDGSVKLLEL